MPQTHGRRSRRRPSPPPGCSPRGPPPPPRLTLRPPPPAPAAAAAPPQVPLRTFAVEALQPGNALRPQKRRPRANLKEIRSMAEESFKSSSTGRETSL